MGYQSKTYSLSDEVVEAIEAAKAKGITPNQLLRSALLGATPDIQVIADGEPVPVDVKRVAVGEYKVTRKPLLKPKERK